MPHLYFMRISTIKKLVAFFSTAILLATFPLAAAIATEVNKNAIVLIVSTNKAGEIVSTGTGFIADPEGTLVTNYHVLVDAAAAKAVFLNGNSLPLESILKIDRARDFAILKLKKDFYSTLELGDSDRVGSFDYTSALGFLTQNLLEEPDGMKGTILQTYGFVLGSHPQAYPDFSYIYTTTMFGPGFSGGPLVNRDNQVVGIATVEGRSINLALPINYVKPYLRGTTGMTFDQLLEQDRNAGEADYYRGNFSLYAQGNPDAAIDYFEKALKKDPNYILAHYDLATALRDQGRIKEAITRYEKVIELNPKFPEALSNLGGFYFREGKVDKAVESFQQAIKVYPNFIQALSNLGAALNKVGRAQEAVTHLQKALKLDPEFAIAHYNLGNAYFTTNRFKEAEEEFTRAVKLGLDFLSLHWKLYEINHKKGNKPEATRQLNIILEIDPLNLEAQQKLSELSAPATQ